MRRHLLWILIFFLFSCQALPVIHEPSSPHEGKSFVCPDPFLKKDYRLVHAIEARLYGSVQSQIIGVTLVLPDARSVSCAIITTEGISLFEAEETSHGINVKRALPPFDSEDFANHMMEDIKLIFRAPEGVLHNGGYLAGGSKVCRYLQDNGDWIDVMENKLGEIQIKRYSSCEVLKRDVRFSSTHQQLYQRISLQANEKPDYFLLMNLIEDQPIKK